MAWGATAHVLFFLRKREQQQQEYSIAPVRIGAKRATSNDGKKGEMWDLVLTEGCA